MRNRLIVASMVVAVGSSAALAQSPGAPLDPNRYENRQPAPSPPMPTDPAADSNPGARVPTAPLGPEADVVTDGVSAGDAGFADSPAGFPADPNSYQNRQPGPSPLTPTDPAAGADPAARVPTIP